MKIRWLVSIVLVALIALAAGWGCRWPSESSVRSLVQADDPPVIRQWIDRVSRPLFNVGKTLVSTYSKLGNAIAAKIQCLFCTVRSKLVCLIRNWLGLRTADC